MSRWENAPDLRDVIRLTYALVDLWCESYAARAEGGHPRYRRYRDTVHGHQQLSLFNAHYDERCFLPIHIYDAAPGQCGRSCARGRRRMARRCAPICAGWCGASAALAEHTHHHSAATAIMAGERRWTGARRTASTISSACPPTRSSLSQVDDGRRRCPRATRHRDLAVVRDYTETRYGAKSWYAAPRRGADRGDAEGLDIRYVVTNITYGTAEWLYDSLYCARGQAENLIKRHKSQLASDRTSCRSPLANQMRLILHTAAYWLMLTVRDAIPKPATWPVPSSRPSAAAAEDRRADHETASRISLAFAAACPDAALFRSLPGALLPLGP